MLCSGAGVSAHLKILGSPESYHRSFQGALGAELLTAFAGGRLACSVQLR